MSLDDLPSDISPSLRDALTEYYEKHGTIPPRRKWPITFGPEFLVQRGSADWMAM